MRLSTKQATLLVIAALILAAPLLFPSSFYYRVGALVFINGLTVIGLVVLIGFAGQISLGHAGFFGIGAYACALMPAHLGVPPALATVLGAVVAGGLAFVVGRPVLRLKGHYLAVATLGLGILVAMVLTNESQLTGGPDGMSVADLGLYHLLRHHGFHIKSSELWYWISSLVMVLGAWLALNIYDSSTGRAFRALHDSEVAARAVGVDVARMKLAAFVISAVYASLAGSLQAMMNKFVTPDVAGFLHSIELVTMAVLGGAGSVAGAVFGATLLTVLPQVLTVFQDYENVVFGLVMMLVMIFLPIGLLPSIARAVRGR